MAQINIPQTLEAGLQHHQAGRLQQAEALYRQILSIEPNHPQALNLLGVIAGQCGRHDLAVELIQRAVTIKPNLNEAYNNLGLSQLAAGKLDDGIKTLRHAVSVQPYSAEARCNLANALRTKGELNEAITMYRQGLNLRPQSPENHYNSLAATLMDVGQFDEAIAACRQGLAVKPNSPKTLYHLGNILQAAGQSDEAIATWQKAVAFDPNFSEAFCNLATALHLKGQTLDAIVGWRRAIALKPDFAEAYWNLGNGLRELGSMDEAVFVCQKAISLKPDAGEAYCNLAAALREQGRIDEAIAASQKAIELRPNLPHARTNLANALSDTGQVSAAIDVCREAIALNPEFIDSYNNLLFSMHFDPRFDARAIADEHEKWNKLHAEPLKKFIQPHANDRGPDRRLRIGYISPDFREHPVGRFIFPLLSHHDKTRFELVAFAQVANPDDVTKRIRPLFDTWHNIVGLSDARVAELVRSSAIDILVDLTMHTASNRMLVFAQKPAPVQVTYLAYCSTTGLETIDYRLSDPYLDPPGEDETVYSEKTIRLPETYWCYQPVDEAGEVNALPAEKNGFVTFGSLNNFCKVTEAALVAWAAVLREVPNSQLLIHSQQGAHRQRVKQLFADNGVENDRIEFVPRAGAKEYFDHYRRIDIALDTFPYNGGTTTCDALWMGVPVISLAGATAVGRAGSSILSNVGLEEFVAWSQEHYIRVAVEWANDLPQLRELRATLRDRMTKSPLLDAPRFTRNVEAIYRDIWRRWALQ